MFCKWNTFKCAIIFSADKLIINFDNCIANFIKNIQVQKGLCVKTDIIKYREKINNKCHNLNTNNNIFLGSSLYDNVNLMISNVRILDLNNDQIFSSCLSAIDIKIESEINIVCKTNSLKVFFIKYQNQCFESSFNSIHIPSLTNPQFITSMASVHRNSIHDRKLFSKLNKNFN